MIYPEDMCPSEFPGLRKAHFTPFIALFIPQMFTHPSLLGLGNVFTKSLRNQLGLHVVTVWLGKQALPLVVIIPYDQSCNWKQEPGWGKQGTIDLGVLGSQRAERRQLLSCNAKA